jgi:hypothetical protein
MEDVKASASAFEHSPVLKSVTPKHAFEIVAGNAFSAFGSRVGDRVNGTSGRGSNFLVGHGERNAFELE